jgi:hypothetical protein
LSHLILSGHLSPPSSILFHSPFPTPKAWKFLCFRLESRKLKVLREIRVSVCVRSVVIDSLHFPEKMVPTVWLCFIVWRWGKFPPPKCLFRIRVHHIDNKMLLQNYFCVC